MTHCERPWLITREGLSSKQNTNRIIEKNNIENYFYTIKADYRVENTKDIKKYSEHLSNKVKEGLFK